MYLKEKKIIQTYSKLHNSLPPRPAQSGHGIMMAYYSSYVIHFKLYSAEPYGSVGSVANLRQGGRRFDPRLGQYSFRGLMTARHCDRIHSSLTAVRCFDNGCGKAASGLEGILCGVLVKRTPGNHG